MRKHMGIVSLLILLSTLLILQFIIENHLSEIGFIILLIGVVLAFLTALISTKGFWRTTAFSGIGLFFIIFIFGILSFIGVI
ncbi:putative membrane protein [Fictibacillus halophilus]|uniref:Membrane protein n=1 Tax=Fictibacillus halophilus TaxID=1610490 RepID=A0ABV2LLB9_9BACL